MYLKRITVNDLIQQFSEQGIPPMRLDIGAAKADSSNAPKLTVESFDNHVYFYSDVDSDRGLALMRELRLLDDRLRNERLSRNVPDEVLPVPIWLHIYSGGGDAFMGFAIADQISTLHTPVHSIVEGYCASAATLISMACAERHIMPNSFMLIHEVRTFFYGKHKDMQDEMNLLDMWMSRAVKYYAAHSKLSESRIREMIVRDWWMDSNEALANGFVDRILEA